MWLLPQVRERAHFSAFIDGDFGAYIAEKRQNAVWGDDPEIQVCVTLPFDVNWLAELTVLCCVYVAGHV